MVVKSLVWGSVYVADKKYFLLEARPEKREYWYPESLVCWLVADAEGYDVGKYTEDDEYKVLYRASRLLVGSNAAVELLDNPQTNILVEYFSAEDSKEEITGNPV